MGSRVWCKKRLVRRNRLAVGVPGRPDRQLDACDQDRFYGVLQGASRVVPGGCSSCSAGNLGCSAAWQGKPEAIAGPEGKRQAGRCLSAEERKASGGSPLCTSSRSATDSNTAPRGSSTRSSLLALNVYVTLPGIGITRLNLRSITRITRLSGPNAWVTRSFLG